MKPRLPYLAGALLMPPPSRISTPAWDPFAGSSVSKSFWPPC